MGEPRVMGNSHDSVVSGGLCHGSVYARSACALFPDGCCTSSLLPQLSVEEGSYVLDYMVGSRQGCTLGSVCAPNTKRLLTGRIQKCMYF